MHNKRFVNILVVLVLLTFPVANIAKSNSAKPEQEPTSRLFLELIRTGYDLVEDEQTFAEICQLLNRTLTKRKEGELRMGIIVNILKNDSIISNIDWRVDYDDYIVPISARSIFTIDVSENREIKIDGISNSISNLQDLARDYIFYPDGLSKRLAIRNIYVEGIGEVETSSVASIINLHVPKKKNLSISDWHFFFECLREVIDLYDNERNKASLELFNKDYSFLSFEEKDKMLEVVGYNIYIEIIR